MRFLPILIFFFSHCIRGQIFVLWAISRFQIAFRDIATYSSNKMASQGIRRFLEFSMMTAVTGSSLILIMQGVEHFNDRLNKKEDSKDINVLVINLHHVQPSDNNVKSDDCAAKKTGKYSKSFKSKAIYLYFTWILCFTWLFLVPIWPCSLYWTSVLHEALIYIGA